MKQGWEYTTFAGVMKPVKSERCGNRTDLPILSITMRQGIILQSERFKKVIASVDTKDYKIIRNGQLVIAFPIDEGLIYTQDVAEEGIMSPAYNVWDVNYSKFNRRFLNIYLHCPWAMNYYKSKLRGTTLRRRMIPKEDLLSLPIPVPPLPEQEKIVSELDCLSGLIEKKRQQLKELDALAQSIFYEMFGNPVENQRGWEVKAIKDVAPQQVYKGCIPCIEGKYWLLNLDVVAPNTGEVLEKCYFDISEIGSSTITFNEDNVLYSKLRPYLNKVVVPDGIGYATSELVPLYPDKEILDKFFLSSLLRSSQFVTYISNKVAGAKMPRVSMSDFRTFPIILPPLPLQQTFAQKVEAIEKQKELIKQSITEAEILLASRMQYYFE